jgi:hypothetical protein
MSLWTSITTRRDSRKVEGRTWEESGYWELFVSPFDATLGAVAVQSGRFAMMMEFVDMIVPGDQVWMFGKLVATITQIF